MPYKNVSDLPASVKDHLPSHAKDIYLNAFNSAWDNYKSKSKRNSPSESQEEVSHKVAWAAVKKKYKKSKDGKWSEK